MSQSADSAMVRRCGWPSTFLLPTLLFTSLCVTALACDDPAGTAAGPASAGASANNAAASALTSTAAAPNASGSAVATSSAAGLAASASTAPSGSANPNGSASANGSANPNPEDANACPADMQLVSGNYCPGVVQKCLEHHPEWNRARARIARLKKQGKKASTSASERCMRYAEPSVCASKKRRPMRFCMDRYEWPNKKGELPAFLMNWHDAVRSCKDIGKRLCTVDEFNFGCEGEEMLPYTYGYTRDPEKCAIDKPYIRRNKSLRRYKACLKNDVCKAEMERLDQREPAGSRPACVSPFGVYDLNGNINEWVRREHQDPPNRSGLKSGWWGPVRGRCRPTVGFHKEDDYGYEVGFRCCKDASADE